MNYFSVTIIIAPTQLRPGAFLSERDKHIQRALSNDRKRSIDQELQSVLRTYLLAFSIGFGGKRARNRAQKLLDFVVRVVKAEQHPI